MEIVLTVGLPAFHARDIMWLSLESLCNQNNINFKWELIIAQEEIDDNYAKEDFIRTYEQRLLNIGCVDIKYEKLFDRMPLSIKWKYIAKMADSKSKVFVLQAADCYSEPNRLRSSFDLIMAGNNWIHNPLGYFYDIHSKKVALYDHTLTSGKTGLNMATETKIMLNLPDIERWRIIDNWIYSTIRHPRPAWNNNADWKHGIDTNGHNNISTSRADMIHSLTPPFRYANKSLKNILPITIVERLENMSVV